eukprot:scaffold185958_cov24-Tisochrysis_lutea.AAC.1
MKGKHCAWNDILWCTDVRETIRKRMHEREPSPSAPCALSHHSRPSARRSASSRASSRASDSTFTKGVTSIREPSLPLRKTGSISARTTRTRRSSTSKSIAPSKSPFMRSSSSSPTYSAPEARKRIRAPMGSSSMWASRFAAARAAAVGKSTTTNEESKPDRVPPGPLSFCSLRAQSRRNSADTPGSVAKRPISGPWSFRNSSSQMAAVAVGPSPTAPAFPPGPRENRLSTDSARLRASRTASAATLALTPPARASPAAMRTPSSGPSPTSTYITVVAALTFRAATASSSAAARCRSSWPSKFLKAKRKSRVRSTPGGLTMSTRRKLGGSTRARQVR